MALAANEIISPNAGWNWRPCPTCRGKGTFGSLYDGFGRLISEDVCPTCGGEGGWPLVTDVDLNVRLKRAKAALKPLRI